VLPERPRRVLMSQDRTCNLSCPSCRTSVFTARKDERERLDALAETVILPMLAEAEEVKVTGSGDPFASAHFRHLLKRLNRRDFPRLKVILQTNGLLFDARAWAELELDGLVRDVWLSIDAATAGTYEVLRRGGKFERLLTNLGFVAGLRRAGRIGGLRLDFVVQRRNFREMPAAVELGRAFGVDRVHFQMIRNWGTFTPAEFQAEYVGAPDHPEYEDLLAVLRHPSLRPPFVDLSTLGSLYERAARLPAVEAA
jgi:MoaA/NifB/PqqE/SkfB family radical SAM enzyme